MATKNGDSPRQRGGQGPVRLPSRALALDQGPVVMGILNVTPDSFSDGGCFLDPAAAADHASRMLAEGARIIDVGPESTRPGASPVPDAEQVRRAVPVIERIRREHPEAIISIDTRSARVAEAALDAGAEIVNDVSALRADSDMAELVARRRAAVVLMHMKGEPRTMQIRPSYGDVMGEIVAFLRERAEAAVEAGIGRDRILVDPGIGFGKTTAHNLEILARLGELHQLELPILVGPSRKRFLGEILGIESPRDRLMGTAGAVAVAAVAGVHVFRVHDVGPIHELLRVIHAVRRTGGSGSGRMD